MLDEHDLDTLFRTARTFSQQPDTWQPLPVSEELLRRVWDLAHMGPTSGNCSPMRVVFAVSKESKARLAPAMDDNNRQKTVEAPATAILGMDLAFYEKLPYLFPHTDAKSWFVGSPEAHIRTTALRNASLQGAYLIMAARALGLDCGPMSGFDNAKVDAAFFAGTTIRSNFIVNLGYGNRAKLYRRNPRLSFDEACRIV
jgi:3-hydroxypropanoate dehydrogenase